MSLDLGVGSLASSDGSAEERIVVTSKLQELGKLVTDILDKNAALSELQKYLAYENWNGIDPCPLCHQPAPVRDDRRIEKSRPSVDKREAIKNQCRSEQSIGVSLQEQRVERPVKLVTAPSEPASKLEPADRSKLKLKSGHNRKRKKHLGNDSSPDNLPPKKSNHLIDEEVVEKPLGRILVPETCPNDTFELERDENPCVPETVPFEEDFVPRKRNKIKSDRILRSREANSEIVKGHGVTVRVDSINPDDLIQPNITSTPVNNTDISGKGRNRSRDKEDYAGTYSQEEDLESNTPLTQIRASQFLPKSNQVKLETPTLSEKSSNLDKSNCLFEDSPDVKESPSLLQCKKENDYFDDEDDDQWLFAVKKESQRKRNNEIEKRVFADLKNTSNVPTPSLLAKKYRQQSIIGLLKKPKIDISDLEAFDGGSLNSKVKSESKGKFRSPLKIRSDVENQPVDDFHEDLKDVLDSDIENIPDVDVIELKNSPSRVKMTNERPRLVRQNAVDFDDAIMDVDTCASVRFGPGARHALDSSDEENPPIRRRQRVTDEDNDEMEFDDAIHHLDFDSQEDEKIFKRPAAPLDMSDTLESSFDRVPKKTEVDYVYHHTDRKKCVREKFPAYDCAECREYFDAAGVPEEERASRMSLCSRHRNLNPPPSTPPGFWDLGFPPTQEQCQRQELRFEEAEEEKARASRKRAHDMPERNVKKGK